MKELIKNRKVVVSAGIVIIILVFAAVFFLSNKTNNSAQQNAAVTPTEIPVLTLNADEIGLTLVEAASMQRATMKITKTTDIVSLDYQLSYNATNPTNPGEKIPRGTIGQVTVKNPGQTISQEMVFGTCSDVCHYDIGVTDVKLIVKVTKTDGKVYQVETTPSSSQ